MTIPSDGYPFWATNSEVDDNGYPNKAQPLQQKRDYGQRNGQNTTRQDLNYMFDLTRQWIQALDEQNRVDGLYTTSNVNMTTGEVANLFGGTWVDIGVSNVGNTASNGLQDVLFDTPVVGTTQHGLLAATAYTASIDVDGAASAISYTPATSTETFSDALTEINVDLAAGTNPATASIVDGNIRIVSTSTGATSTILIADVDLFSSLLDYATIATPIDGAATHSVKTFKRTA